MTKKTTIIAAFAAAFMWAGASGARAADAVDAIVAESTSTQKLTIEDLYKGARYRDPFMKLSAGDATAPREEKEFSLETFSIHALKLKGIMKEKTGVYAVLIDEETRMGFLLQKRRLYTYKNERIPGVTGKIDIEQKSVTLMTAEKDVQTLRLGEEEEADEGAAADEPKD